MTNNLLRLSKLMSERGLCSRREADELIARGWVKVDGVTVSQLGSKVSPTAIIELATEARRELQNQVTILLNKPVGFVSSQPEKDYRAAVDLIVGKNQDAKDRKLTPFLPQHRRGLAPAGRLDIDSQGLLVLTQNGAIAKRLIGEDSPISKEYLVRVSGSLDKSGLERLRHGLSLDNRPLKPAQVEWINEDQLRFVLLEGRKRQIRRMCEAVGITVHGLKRVAIGKVKLGSLADGQWRFLRPDEEF